MYLVEPMLPFQGGFDFAAELAIKQRGLKLLLLLPHNHFKGIHLSDLDLDTMEEHPAFRKDIAELERSMRSATTSVWTPSTSSASCGRERCRTRLPGQCAG